MMIRGKREFSEWKRAYTQAQERLEEAGLLIDREKLPPNSSQEIYEINGHLHLGLIRAEIEDGDDDLRGELYKAALESLGALEGEPGDPIDQVVAMVGACQNNFEEGVVSDEVVGKEESSVAKLNEAGSGLTPEPEATRPKETSKTFLTWLGKHKKALAVGLLITVGVVYAGKTVDENTGYKADPRYRYQTKLRDGYHPPKELEPKLTDEVIQNQERDEGAIEISVASVGTEKEPPAVPDKVYRKEVNKGDTQTGLALEVVNEYAAEYNHSLDDDQGIKAAVSLAKQMGWRDHIEAGESFDFEASKIKEALDETEGMAIKDVLKEARGGVLESTPVEVGASEAEPVEVEAEIEDVATASTSAKGIASLESESEEEPTTDEAPAEVTEESLAPVLGIYDVKGHVIENVDDKVGERKVRQEVGRLKDKLLDGAMDKEPMSAYEWIETKRKLREIDRESAVISIADVALPDYAYDSPYKREMDSVDIQVSENVWQPNVEKELRTRLRKQGLDYNALNAWVLNTRGVQTELWLYSPTDSIKTFSLYEKWRQKMVLHNLKVAIDRAEKSDDDTKVRALKNIEKALKSTLDIRGKYNEGVFDEAA